MLYWALVFLLVAIVAGALGFGGIAGAAGGIAHIIFYVFLVLLLVSLIMHFAKAPHLRALLRFAINLEGRLSGAISCQENIRLALLKT